MSAEGVSTRIGCPDVCPSGVDLTGIESFKTLRMTDSLEGVLLRSIDGTGDEEDMVPLLQNDNGKERHNGFADDMFPICVYALDGASKPTVCPNRALINAAKEECLKLGAMVMKEGK